MKVKVAFGFICTGIIISLIVLELVLRLVGAVYTDISLHDTASTREHGASFVILCVGDSFTQGVGASMANTYPAQLKKCFKEWRPDMNVEVVNKGFGGSNSAMVLDRLDKDLEKVKPDIVVLLAGGNNRWNVYGYSRHLDHAVLCDRWLECLNEIKVFKLARLFLLEVRSKNFGGDRVTPGRVVDHDPEIKEWMAVASRCEWQEGNYDEAIGWYKKILKKKPGCVAAYHQMGRLYWKKEDRERSRECYRKAIELDPVRNVYSYADYADRFIFNSLQNGEDLRFIARFSGQNPVVGDILMAASRISRDRAGIRAWIDYDITEIIQKIRKRNARVIVQNYPDYNGSLSGVNHILAETAKMNSVVFIDNDGFFKELFLKGALKNDYFAFDKFHCNEKGYGILARNVYSAIINIAPSLQTIK